MGYGVDVDVEAEADHSEVMMLIVVRIVLTVMMIVIIMTTVMVMMIIKHKTCSLLSRNHIILKVTPSVHYYFSSDLFAFPYISIRQSHLLYNQVISLI